MGYAKHVGRVGALALVLGVGIGLGAAPGIACADELGGITSSPSGDSPKTDADSNAHQDSPEAPDGDETAAESGDAGDGPAPEDFDVPAENVEGDAAPDLPPEPEEAPVEDFPAEVVDPEDPGPTPEPQPTSHGKSRGSRPSVEPAIDDGEPQAVGTGAPDADGPGIAAPPVAENPIILREPTSTQSVITGLPLPADAEAPTSPAAAGVLSVALSALVDTGMPGGAPIVAPAMFLLAAGTRRELASPNVAPTASLAYLTSPSWLGGTVRGDVNGSDVDRDRLTYSVSAPAKGTVTINRNGNFSYRPSTAGRHAAASASATTSDKTDTFVVTVSDGNGGTALVPITVAIKPLNAKPNARNTVGRPDPISGIVTGSIIATDKDGDAVTFSAPAITGKGTVVVSSDGTFTYSPTTAARQDARSIFRRVDSFTVTVNDGHGGIDTTTVSVRIAPLPANSAPTNGTYTVTSTGVNGAVTGTVMASDANGDPLRFSGPTSTQRGSVAVAPNGTFTYTPTVAARHAAAADNATAEVKADSFTVTVSDGKGGVLSVPVSVTISPTNSTPDGTATFGAPDSTTGAITGTVTAADGDNDTLTYSGSGVTPKGGVVITSTGGFTYTPTASARQDATTTPSTDSFTVTVSDGHGGVDAVEVTVPISPLPASGDEPATGVISVPNPSGGALEYEVNNDATAGTATVDSAGTWTYTPTPDTRHQAAADNATAADRQRTFTVSVTDSEGKTTVVPITVAIVGANEIPVAIEQPEQQIDTESGTTAGVLIVTDADGDPLAADIDVDPELGAVTYDISTGVWIFEATPQARHAAAAALAGAGGSVRMMRGFAALAAAGDPTTATVTFTFQDGYGGVQTAVIDVQISPANETPVVTPVTGGFPNPNSGTVTGTIGFSDPDGDSPVFGVGTSTKGVEVLFDGVTGQWTYTPTTELRDAASAPTATTADRFDTFTVTVDDGHGGAGSVDITVPILFGVTTSGSIVMSGFTSRPVVVSPDGRHIYISGEDYDRVSRTTEYTLTIVDTTTKTGYLVPISGEPTRPVIISPDGAHAYATVGNTVYVIDTRTATSQSVSLPGTPYDYIVVSADGAHAYASSRVGGGFAVTAITAATGASTDIALPGNQFIDLQVADDGRHAHVVTGNRDGTGYTLTVIDTATNAARTVALPDHLADRVHVTADGLRAYSVTYDDTAASLWVTDMTTGESELGLIWRGGKLYGSPAYSADDRFAYLVTSLPGEEPNTYDIYFNKIDMSVLEGGGNGLRGTPNGPITLSADGTIGYLLAQRFNPQTESFEDYFDTAGDPNGEPGTLYGRVRGPVLFSEDKTIAYAGIDSGYDLYALAVIGLSDASTNEILLPAQAQLLELSADGTRVFGTTSTGNGAEGFEHSFVVVDTVTGSVQSIDLPGNIFDRVALSPDQSRLIALTANITTGDELTYLLSFIEVPLPTSGAIEVSNPSGGALSYAVNDDGSRGTASVDENGVWAFQPDAETAHQAAADNASSADKRHGFTVTVTDSEGTSTVVPITAGIIGSNVAPYPYGAEDAQALDNEIGTTTGVLGVADGDGDPLTVSIDVDPSLGTVTYDIATGVWIFQATPEARHAAAAALANAAGAGTVSATDPVDSDDDVATPGSDDDASGPEDTEPTDTPVDESPSHGGDSGTGTQDSPSEPDDDAPNAGGPKGSDSGGGAGSDDGGSSTGSSGSSGSSKSGARTFAVSSVDPTVATVTFTFRDDHGGVQTAVVQVRISPANEVPVITEIFTAAPDPATGVATGIIAVTDGDDDTITFSAPGNSVKGGTVSVDDTGHFVYTPTAGMRDDAAASLGEDTDSFTVTVNDGHGGTQTTAVSVIVTPPFVVSGTQGYPNNSLVVGSTGYGYQFVTLTDSDTKVIVITPGGVASVAGTVLGNPSLDYEKDGPAPILRSDGGIVFTTQVYRGSFRIVSVSTDGTLTVAYTGQKGRWLHSGDGTHYFVGTEETQAGGVSTKVVRLAADGIIETHSALGGVDINSDATQAVVGPDGSLFVAINPTVSFSPFGDRAVIWVISPSGVEATYSLTSLTGTELTDYSSPHEIAVTADGTAYLIAATAVLEGSTPVQAASVLVVDANGVSHRVDLPGAGGAYRIATAGNYGVVVSGDGTTAWVSVIDAGGAIVNHPVTDAPGVFVAAADGSGAYATALDGNVIYVSAGGTLSTLAVGTNDGTIVAGPDGSVYLVDSATDTLFTIKAGVVSTATVDGDISFKEGAYQFAPDGKLVFLLTDYVVVRVAVPSTGVTSAPLTVNGFYRFGLRFVGDMTVLTAVGQQGVKVLALDSDGTTLFNRTFQGGDGDLTGDVEVAPDGTVYATFFEEVANVPTTQIWAVDSAGARQVFSISAYPAGAWKPSAKTAVLRADGKLLVTVTVPDDELEVVTKVYVVDPSTAV